ncbi:MAG: PSD1 and planctomycete cytochrome C domain-containing protein [Verrucomicrobiales bacterium]|nr:PSD1 and planctomycete cytochrome C domain-containing protein [Verrucomicrobiales bacterium]
MSGEVLRYNRDVRPILAEHCFNCHGADEKARKAKLRLDDEASARAERDGVIAIVPGDVDASELVWRLFSDDGDEVMPPPEHPLEMSAAERATLKQWVAEGAEYEGHWAFAPVVAGEGGSIDGFVKEGLAGTGLAMKVEATRETLIRRLSLDLTGLPPTVEEVEAFVADRGEGAYGRVVDRLLASPRYGERMASWWLDGARYADSHGFQADWERYQWPWRDWVIDAFNRNQRFDEFTVEQLAGDMLPGATTEQVVATGFNRNHRVNTEGGSLDAEWLVENVIDRVETTGSVWLGLTMGCARCHDHKYDPISQKEFYGMFAFFHNVPEQGKGPGKQGNFEPTIRAPRPGDLQRMEELGGLIVEAEAEVKFERARLSEVVAAWEEKFRAGEVEVKKSSWSEADVTRVESTGGATFSRLEDGSWLAGGAVADTDVYEVVVPVPAGVERVAGVMIECLPDPSLPVQSVGRHANGNFVLSGVSLAREEAKFVRAAASYEQKGWGVAKAVDGNAATGWAVDGPSRREASKAAFFLDAPVVAKGGVLGLKLHFEALATHSMGRFKVSLTAAGDAPLEGGEGISAAVVASLGKAAGERSAGERQQLRAYVEKNAAPELAAAVAVLAGLKSEREAIGKKAPTVMVMREMDRPRKTYVLERGEYDKRGEEVSAMLPAAFPGMPEGEAMNRLGLARWIVAADNPLTSRVQVNRVWEMLFGTGLVKTSENFGTQADLPSHPELLDWLAAEFLRSGWDVKGILKTVVTSATYRQSSEAPAGEWVSDPENRLLARGPRFRVQAETVRDQALFLGGLLTEKLGGPSVYPYQPEGIWSEFNFYGNLRNYKHARDENLYRRSLYTIWKRTAAPPGMTLFDMPGREICTVKRSRTNTPLQALALLNDVTYVEASRAFAERMLGAGKTVREQVEFGFRCATGRLPARDELATLVGGFERRKAAFVKDERAAVALLEEGESAYSPVYDVATLAAMTTTASVLINLDETITKE